jgi:endonuclease/exonuclease/phosphatase family metal-dependent hydrolase
VALLVVPIGLWLARPSPGIDRTPRSSIRIVSYNLHLAVSTEGQVDPAAIARVIEREEPQAIVLQEVGRGWAIGGMTDLAEWLAWRLEMPYAYRHAADRQFGNAILTRLPLVGIEGGSLPFGRGPQSRSWLRVRVAPEDGPEIDLIGTHLQHQEHTDTRLRQIEALLEAWGGSRPAVIAGDMNAQPGDPELRRFADAGLVSAQDEIGDPSRSTAAIPRFPGDRIDYVFGAGVTFEAFRIPLSFGSDHLPLAVTVSPAS